MNKELYEQKMNEIDKLIDADPAPDTPEGKRLLELTAEVQEMEADEIEFLQYPDEAILLHDPDE